MRAAARLLAARGYDQTDMAALAWRINNTYVMFLAALVIRLFMIRMQEYLEIDGELDEQTIHARCARAIHLIQVIVRPPPAAGS